MNRDIVVNSHALLSPSSAHRWLSCPGSVDPISLLPKGPSNPAAEEGNRLHKVAEQYLKAFSENKELPPIDDNVRTYIDYVVEQFHELSMLQESKLHIEVRLEQTNYVGKYKIFGTVDCIIETGDFIDIVDYKSGFQTVSAFENVQLGIYAILAQLKFNKPIRHLTIVQRDQVRHYEINKSFLETLGHDLRRVQVSLENQTNVKTVAGNWCTYCPLKFGCAKYAESVNPIVKQLPDPAKLDNENLAKMYDITNFLAMYIKAVNEEVENRVIVKRESVPGYKLIRGRGSRSWGKSDAEIIDILKNNGYSVSDITENKLLSFTKIEKLDKKAKELVTTLTSKGIGALKVVSNKEPGEPVVLIQGDVLPAIE